MKNRNRARNQCLLYTGHSVSPKKLNISRSFVNFQRSVSRKITLERSKRVVEHEERKTTKNRTQTVRILLVVTKMVSMKLKTPSLFFAHQLDLSYEECFNFCGGFSIWRLLFGGFSSVPYFRRPRIVFPVIKKHVLLNATFCGAHVSEQSNDHYCFSLHGVCSIRARMSRARFSM